MEGKNSREKKKNDSQERRDDHETATVRGPIIIHLQFFLAALTTELPAECAIERNKEDTSCNDYSNGPHICNAPSLR